MIIKALSLSLAIACSLWACTAAAPEPQSEPALPGDDEVPASVERFIAPTPAMLAAALRGDPTEMQTSVAFSGCMAPSTCPASFGSCGAWSAPAECGVTCTVSPICTCPIKPEHPDDPPNEPCEPDLSVKRGKRTFNSFRVCFNPQAQACTEWKQTLQFFCGC